jgi:hypothetical protein
MAFISDDDKCPHCHHDYNAEQSYNDDIEIEISRMELENERIADSLADLELDHQDLEVERNRINRDLSAALEDGSECRLAAHVLLDWIKFHYGKQPLPPWEKRWPWLSDDVV